MTLLEHLDNPFIWNLSRLTLDLFFGLYKKRFEQIKEWNVLNDSKSVLDIGCGIGQYSKITNGRYLGVDLESKYIEYCKKKLSSPNKSFRCLNVSELLNENLKFDIVLMVDFLHHIPDELCIKLLNTTADLANDFIINFEPIIEQTNSIGKLFIKHDRGDYIRTLENFHNIYKKSRLEIIESKKFVLGPFNTRAILAKPR